jgi:hypothetical protein
MRRLNEALPNGLTHTCVHAMSAGRQRERAMDGGARATWTAFLVMTFVVVGLAGVFASYAAPLPLARALAREAALDAAATALHAPDPAAVLEALRPRLGESAEAILPMGGDMPARIAAERIAMRARFTAEAEAEGRRARLIVIMVTLMGAAFGAAVLRMARQG